MGFKNLLKRKIIAVAIEPLDRLRSEPAHIQQQTFNTVLQTTMMRKAIDLEPRESIEKIFETVKAVAPQNRLPALKTALADPSIRASLAKTHYRVENVFTYLWELSSAEVKIGFDHIMKTFNGIQKSFFPRWCFDHIFCAIQNMESEQVQQQAFNEALENGSMIDFMSEVASRNYPKDYDQRDVAKFMLAILDYLPFRYLSQALTNTHVIDAISKVPRSIFDVVALTPLNKELVLKTLISCAPINKALEIKQDNRYYLRKSLEVILDVDGKTENTTDELRADLARVFIGSVQERVSDEDLQVAVNVTPLLNVESELVAVFAWSLSNEARKRRRQPEVSYSQISREFDAASLGWVLRPINSADEQMRYKSLLPGNANLFSRAVKRISQQEIHAVIGNKSYEVHISIE